MRKILLWSYAGIVIACLFPHVRWWFGDDFSADPLWLRELYALLLIPSAPLMVAMGFHPNKVLLGILAPIYLAFLFWPMPLIALKPKSLQVPWVRNVATIYAVLLLCGCGTVLLLISTPAGGWM